MKQANLPAKDLVAWISPVLLIIVFLCGFLPNLYSQHVQASLTAYISPQLRLNEINSSAYRHFRDNFKNVSNEEWIRDDKDFVAKFAEGKIRNRVYYNSKGEFQCAMKSYGAEWLNPELHKKLHDKFEGYTIKTITELSNLEGVVYYVVIENHASVKKLECVNDKITVTEEYVNGGL